MTTAATDRARAWALGALLAGVLLFLAGDLLALALHKNFALDEFQYAHAAYAIAHGQEPYRDFFDVHLPLNYQLLSLLFRFGAHSPSAILGMRGVMLGWAALTLFSAWLSCRRFGALRALLGPIFVLLVVPLWSFGHELRHDPIALALLLFTLGARELPVAPRVSSALSGVACTLCFWSTQKALLFAGAVLLPALALDLWQRRRGEQALLLAEPRAWLSGAGATAGAIVLWLVATSNLGPFVYYCFVWAEHYQSSYPRLSMTEQLWPQLDNFAMLLPFAIGGVWATARSAGSPSASPSERRDLLLLAALVATFASYALSQAPFPYSAVPFWGVLGVLCARGVLELWARASAERDPPWAARAALGAALIVLCFVVPRAHALYRARIAANDNSYQLGVLRQIEELTHDDDAFFDCAGNYVARPHSYFYIYIDALLRHEIPNLAADVEASLERAETIGVIPDVRYGGLPQSLRSFLEAHYQKYSGDLWLYGQSFDAASARAGVSFRAVKAGRYFANGAGGELNIDGQPVNAADFTLTRGEHRVVAGRAQSALQVLWLPKNDERWHPRQDARPAFSTVF